MELREEWIKKYILFLPFRRQAGPQQTENGSREELWNSGSNWRKVGEIVVLYFTGILQTLVFFTDMSQNN